ncbi:MAG: phasin family protein, partial [Pseudomonadota bacterium]
YQSYFDGLSNVSAEAYRFMSQRFEEDMRLSTAISQCRDAGEVLELQRAFCTKLVDDYVTEMGRLMALATDSVANDKPSTP